MTRWPLSMAVRWRQLGRHQRFLENTSATRPPTARTGQTCLTPKLDPLLGLHFGNVLGDALCAQRRPARRLFAAHTPRPALSDPFKGHPHPTPGHADNPPDLGVIPSVVGEVHDQTIALDRVHRRWPSRPQKAGLKLRGSGDLIRAASTHALSVDRPGRYGRHDKRGAASIAVPA